VIRVLIAEDHPVVRVGLERLLANEDDIELVGAVENGAEAIDAAERLRPDVVLMDLSMPGTTGTEATARIVADHDRAITVVILTSFSDRSEILAALDAGASGYLLKDAEPDELLRGIRAAARGESPIDPKAAREVLTTRLEREREPDVQLSPRELDVLRLVARGMPNKRIARELAISEKTVKAHLTNIFQRIGVFDRVPAAIWARQQGIS
jgi:DNA-binding NarL/FixJ family response regulator